MEHSEDFYVIKEYYDNGYWNKKMVKKAVKTGRITQEECDEILGVN